MQLEGINREQLVKTIARQEAILEHARGLLALMDGEPGSVLIPSSTGKLKLGQRRDLFAAIRGVVPKAQRKKGSQWQKPWLRQLMLAHTEHREALLKDGKPDPLNPLDSWFARNSDPRRVKHPLLKQVKKAQGRTPAVYELVRGLDDPTPE